MFTGDATIRNYKHILQNSINAAIVLHQEVFSMGKSFYYLLLLLLFIDHTHIGTKIHNT